MMVVQLSCTFLSYRLMFIYVLGLQTKLNNIDYVYWYIIQHDSSPIGNDIVSAECVDELIFLIQIERKK